MIRLLVATNLFALSSGMTLAPDAQQVPETSTGEPAGDGRIFSTTRRNQTLSTVPVSVTAVSKQAIEVAADRRVDKATASPSTDFWSRVFASSYPKGLFKRPTVLGPKDEWYAR